MDVSRLSWVDVVKALRSKAYPTDRLLNPAFRYTSAWSTDIRRLFARVRAELSKQPDVKVIRLNARKK